MKSISNPLTSPACVGAFFKIMCASCLQVDNWEEKKGDIKENDGSHVFAC